MLDWGILIVCTVVVLWLMLKGYRWLRREEQEEQAIVMPDTMRYAYEVRDPASASAAEIAQRVHDHERARERQERAECLLDAVTKGEHKPDKSEVEFLNEYYNIAKVNAALTTGMWTDCMLAIDQLTRQLEDLKAAQPTLIVAEMPERVG